jgi:hypothetical protein
MAEIGDFESAKEVLPAKMAAVAKTIRKNLSVLEQGGKIYFARKDVQSKMDCDRFVDDARILDAVKSKCDVLTREGVFNGHSFGVGYEKNMFTKDGDRVLFIEYAKKSEDGELVSLDGNQLVNEEGDEFSITVGGKPVRNGKAKDKFLEKDQKTAG